MNDDKSIQLQAATLAVLNRIASALEAIALTKAPAPNFVRPIAEYATFEFESIGAKVVGRDQHGVTAVEWAGYQWTRRSPSNKFGSAIWFSRAAGKDEAGNVRYVRLLTFREPTKPEPLPDKVMAQIERPAIPASASAPAPATLKSGNGSPPELHGTDRLHSGGSGVTYGPVEPEVGPDVAWPENEVEFIAWLKAKGVSGKTVHGSLGMGAAQWLKQNPAQGYVGLAQTLSAALALDETIPA
jgi:hypothetical protein